MYTTGSSRRQDGFSIVEALVALVVLAVGMLGIAGLYVTTLRSSGSAISRMQAVNLASDLADRIRANRNGGVAYTYNNTSNPSDLGCATGANCNAAQMAETDLALWEQQIAATLPAGATGVVVVDESAGVPRTYTITVSWREPGQAANDFYSYALRMQI